MTHPALGSAGYRYVYDSGGDLVTKLDPSGNATTYSYDARGNMLTKRDANGGMVRFEYDPLGRATKVFDPLNHGTEFYYAKGCGGCGGGGGGLTKVHDALWAR